EPLHGLRVPDPPARDGARRGAPLRWAAHLGGGMRLTSAGAARTVTGSCHLLEAGGARVLVDCGLFQGPAELEALNAGRLPFDPAALDAVLVTHGHLDHVGRLPLLARLGYKGPFLATAATREIAAIILRD